MVLVRFLCGRPLRCLTAADQSADGRPPGRPCRLAFRSGMPRGFLGVNSRGCIPASPNTLANVGYRSGQQQGLAQHCPKRDPALATQRRLQRRQRSPPRPTQPHSIPHLCIGALPGELLIAAGLRARHVGGRQRAVLPLAAAAAAGRRQRLRAPERAVLVAENPLAGHSAAAAWPAGRECLLRLRPQGPSLVARRPLGGRSCVGLVRHLHATWVAPRGLARRSPSWPQGLVGGPRDPERCPTATCPSALPPIRAESPRNMRSNVCPLRRASAQGEAQQPAQQRAASWTVVLGRNLAPGTIFQRGG